MTEYQKRLLSRMKKLINDGCKKFEERKDRDYVQDLLNIGITLDEAWQEILSLSSINYFPDQRPIYLKKGDDALVFKKSINNNIVYIKIKMEPYNNHETTVCLSFHIDHK